MTFGETAGLAVGILAIVAPEWLPRTSTLTRGAITTIGFVLLGYSGVVALQDWTNMKVQSGPLIAIIIGGLIAAGGVFWHIRLSAAPAHSPSLPASAAAPAKNEMGNVIDNRGIITQGQTGDNRK